MKNYYEILEVSKKASKDTINKVFKMHMKANHPDLFQGEEKVKAEERSKELTEAYNILSDDAARSKYDQELEAEESTSSYAEIKAVLEENEYLKQVIAKKDEYIYQLTNTYQPPNSYNNTNYGNNNYNSYNNYNSNEQYYNNQQSNSGYGFNGFSPPPPQQSNPYAGMTEEQLRELKRQETRDYYVNMLKQTGIRAFVVLLLLSILLVSIWSSFRDLFQMFGN